MKIAYKTTSRPAIDIRDPGTGALLEQVQMPAGYPDTCVELDDSAPVPDGYVLAAGGYDEIRALQASHKAAVDVIEAKIRSTAPQPQDEVASIKERLAALEAKP